MRIGDVKSTFREGLCKHVNFLNTIYKDRIQINLRRDKRSIGNCTGSCSIRDNNGRFFPLPYPIFYGGDQEKSSVTVKSCHNFEAEDFNQSLRSSTNFSIGLKAKGQIVGVNSELLKAGLISFFTIFRFYLDLDQEYQYEIVTRGFLKDNKISRNLTHIDITMNINCERINDTKEMNHYLLWLSVSDWFGDPLFEKVILFSRAPSRCDFKTQKISWNYEIRDQLSRI